MVNNRGIISKLYSQLAKLTNMTIDSHYVYLKLFSMTDFNQGRLVRAKMRSIFKLYIRWILALLATFLNQGSFEGMKLS